ARRPRKGHAAAREGVPRGGAVSRRPESGSIPDMSRPGPPPSDVSARESGDALAAAARRCELRGQARAALLEVGGALDDYADAEARWSRLGATDAVCRTWVRAATLYLRGLGNLSEAAVWLEQARHARGDAGSDAWAHATLARADLLFLRGNAARAAEL